MTVFDPATNPRAFRTALGRFPTGVTIITIKTPNGPMGITANSFASLSLDPPLVSWAPAKTSQRHDPFVTAKHFNVHILQADQADHAIRFTREHAPFSCFLYDLDSYDIPVLQNCLAVFGCRRYATHPVGDHTLIVGQVLTVQDQTGAPLTFQNGQFWPEE